MCTTSTGGRVVNALTKKEEGTKQYKTDKNSATNPWCTTSSRGRSSTCIYKLEKKKKKQPGIFVVVAVADRQTDRRIDACTARKKDKNIKKKTAGNETPPPLSTEERRQHISVVDTFASYPPPRPFSQSRNIIHVQLCKKGPTGRALDLYSLPR